MSWKRVTGAVTGALLLVVLLAYGMTLDPRALPSTLPGQPAPSFELQAMAMEAAGPDGEPRVVRLEDHLGEVVVLNFWASWCLACRDEHRPLSNVADRYAGQGVHFYGVLYNDSEPNGRRWIRQMGGQSYLALLDPGAVTAINYGLYGVPETFIIGPDGLVAYKHVGPVTEQLLIDWIERVRAPSPEPTEETS